MKVYICIPCGFICDEEIGSPEYGIDPGSSFESFADDWVCPECGGVKENFTTIPLDIFLEEDAS
ncbi:MAG: rubredoxin [Pseudomonadota bacterium]